MKGRRQSFTVPNNRGAEAPTPAPKPAARPAAVPRLVPPRAWCPSSGTSCRRSPTPRAWRRLNTSGSGVGERQSMNTTGGSGDPGDHRAGGPGQHAAREERRPLTTPTLSRLLRSFGL
ncbi:MAG: hypothetical protein IPN01_29485 [Deltaproteobacteria bacterium]|nr:hypothetical protein [Deltaproteobacteria bacterium]